MPTSRTLRLLTQIPLLALFAAPAHAQAWQDPAAHTVRMVPVDKDVELEVLDWGGGGRPLVLLTGLGNTAHVYDGVAAKLAAKYHVYAITRRGFGSSSAPKTGYDADRLGDDVVAVLDGLKIVRPVLAGHSIAGEELSSIVTRHPARIAGAIYLDAALSFAFYVPELGDMNLDSLAVTHKIEQLSHQPPEPLAIVQQLLDTDMPAYERDLREFQRRFAEMGKAPQQPRHDPTAADRATFAAYRDWQARTDNMLFPEAELREQFSADADGSVGRWKDHGAVIQAIVDGERKFTALSGVRLLAIYAMDPAHGKEAQSAAFEKANPSAPVVRLKDANHYVFLSNEAEVLGAMNDFIASLP
jgi:non-heme chloroperoxidase